MMSRAARTKVDTVLEIHRSDPRPRVDRYNQVVYEFLERTQGSTCAREGLAQIESEQKRLGLSSRMRYPKDAASGHMRGYPVIDLTSECRKMALATRQVRWFS